MITVNEATVIAKHNYGLEGEVSSLPGEMDFNFNIKTAKGKYLLKVSRPSVDLQFIEFQQALIAFVSKNNQTDNVSLAVQDDNGNYISKTTDTNGDTRIVRLLSWIDGRLLSSVNPKSHELLLSLGQKAGSLTKLLQGFDHKMAHRKMKWDISQAAWTFDHIHLFDSEQQIIINNYHQRFKDLQPQLNNLRKAVVHNDVNDNNVLVSDDLLHPKVTAIIDFGDAIYTPIINDLAITIAYAVMNKADVLGAALPNIKGYHQQFPLLEEELKLLYTRVDMR